MSFRDLAMLLLPTGTGGAVCEVGDDWKVDRGALSAAGGGVWGREPTWTPAGPALVRSAVLRESGLARLRARPPSGLSVAAVHRWSHDFIQARHLPRTLARLRSGLIAEVRADPDAPRVIDAAAADAGAMAPLGSLHFGAGGQISARAPLGGGEPGLLRVARGGSPVAPRRAADALVRLAPLELPQVPRLVGSGSVTCATWTAETMLPGVRARALSSQLVAEVAGFCARLPRSPGPPTAFASDMAMLVERLPRHRDLLLELEARAALMIETLPAVLRHGDLWQGNLLVHGGRLAGVVDWDAWHPSGVPGTDLLHLLASAHAFATRRSFGQLMLDRPWERPAFAAATAAYWRGFGITPSPAQLRAVGIAWWAMHTWANLWRHPHVAGDPSWLRTSVEPLVRLGV